MSWREHRPVIVVALTRFFRKDTTSGLTTSSSSFFFFFFTTFFFFFFLTSVVLDWASAGSASIAFSAEPWSADESGFPSPGFGTGFSSLADSSSSFLFSDFFLLFFETLLAASTVAFAFASFSPASSGASSWLTLAGTSSFSSLASSGLSSWLTSRDTLALASPFLFSILHLYVPASSGAGFCKTWT